MSWWREGATTAQSMSLQFTSPGKAGARKQSPWKATTFGYILPLFEGEDGEVTYAEHFFPDTECDEVIRADGQERFVLTGECMEDGVMQSPWSYKRYLNAGQTVKRRSGANGCLTIVKARHLGFMPRPRSNL